MPTGPNDLNPHGLAEAGTGAGRSANTGAGLHLAAAPIEDLCRQVRRSSHEAERKAIRDMLREAGVSGRVSLEEINPDRKISIKLCGPRGRCITFELEY
jgi:hypothetical protein